MLNRQLGGKAWDAWDVPPGKPKWMRWRTYERKLAEWERITEHPLRGLSSVADGNGERAASAALSFCQFRESLDRRSHVRRKFLASSRTSAPRRYHGTIEHQFESSASPSFEALPRGLSVRTHCESTRSRVKPRWEEMIYRISYEDGWAAITETGATRTEYFRAEHEALHRARELVESGVHHGVSVYDADGVALSGLRLQLRLGASATD
jgi:hypothetical protein